MKFALMLTMVDVEVFMIWGAMISAAVSTAGVFVRAWHARSTEEHSRALADQTRKSLASAQTRATDFDAVA
jgi:hypothetical protein